MTIDEQISVMQGYKDGKSVQMARKGNTKAEKWVDQDYPVFDFSQYDFRLKQEPEPPKYEPFSFEDDLVGKVVVYGKERHLITSQEELKVYVSSLGWVDYDSLFTRLKNEEGKPFGKLVQQ